MFSIKLIDLHGVGCLEMFVVDGRVNVALRAQKVKRLSDLALRHILKVTANVSDVNALARFGLFYKLRYLLREEKKIN